MFSYIAVLTWMTPWSVGWIKAVAFAGRYLTLQRGSISWSSSTEDAKVRRLKLINIFRFAWLSCFNRRKEKVGVSFLKNDLIHPCISLVNIQLNGSAWTYVKHRSDLNFPIANNGTLWVPVASVQFIIVILSLRICLPVACFVVIFSLAIPFHRESKSNSSAAMYSSKSQLNDLLPS